MNKYLPAIRKLNEQIGTLVLDIDRHERTLRDLKTMKLAYERAIAILEHTEKEQENESPVQ